MSESADVKSLQHVNERMDIWNGSWIVLQDGTVVQINL